MKWCVISAEVGDQKLAQILSQYLNQIGIENEFQFLAADPVSFADIHKEALQNFDQIRLGRPFGQHVIQLYKKMESQSSQLGAADCIVKADSGVWPRSALYRAWASLLGLWGDKLKVDSAALVVGAGASARISIASLIRVGFQRIHVTSTFDDEGLALIKEMKRSFVGIEFEFIGQDKLVLLPGNHGILVNTTPLIPENDILKELYYFNFLQKDGMVWDLTIEPWTTALVQQAEEVGASVIRGAELKAWTDAHWVQWVVPENKRSAFDQKAYFSLLQTQLASEDPKS